MPSLRAVLEKGRPDDVLEGNGLFEYDGTSWIMAGLSGAEVIERLSN